MPRLESHGPGSWRTSRTAWSRDRHRRGRGERALDEVILNLIILASAQQDSVGAIDRTAGSSDLLIVSDDRSWPLKMNHERKVGFVESHSQRDGCYQRRDLVVEQRF